VTRPDGNRTWGSPRWITFTGLSFSVVFGWLDAVHRDLDAAQAGWSKAQENGEYSVVHRVPRAADGEYRWHPCGEGVLDSYLSDRLIRVTIASQASFSVFGYSM
jgi:hypothetical protein